MYVPCVVRDPLPLVSSVKLKNPAVEAASAVHDVSKRPAEVRQADGHTISILAASAEG